MEVFQNAAPQHVVAGRLALGRAQLLLEELRGDLAGAGQIDPHRLAFAVARVGLGQRHAGLLGQPLDRLREGQPFRLGQELEVMARRPAAEAMVDAAPVVAVEGRRLLFMKRAAGPEIAARRLALALVIGDAPPHHLADRQPGPDLVEKRRFKAHGRHIRIGMGPLQRLGTACHRSSQGDGLCRRGRQR